MGSLDFLEAPTQLWKLQSCRFGFINLRVLMPEIQKRAKPKEGSHYLEQPRYTPLKPVHCHTDTFNEPHLHDGFPFVNSDWWVPRNKGVLGPPQH